MISQAALLRLMFSICSNYGYAVLCLISERRQRHG